MKFIDKNGKKHDSAFFNGYKIADRKLEGVMIDVVISDDGKILCSFGKKYSSYLEDFNTKKLLKDAQGYVQDLLDEGEMEMLSLSGGSRVNGLEYDNGKPFAVATSPVASSPAHGFAVRPSSFSDVINKINKKHNNKGP